ncbi:hypothetical protein [Brevibacillus brevis]|uniref:ATP dependent DNA ligase n=1 Tax=Brevibacillus brevis TaxID=1393 RepID=UPI002ED40B09
MERISAGERKSTTGSHRCRRWRYASESYCQFVASGSVQSTRFFLVHRHAGTGKLTQTDWRTFTERIQPLVQQKMAFVNKPPRAALTLWIKPKITVKIKFAEWKECVLE